MSNNNRSPIYFCYSPKLNEFLHNNGLSIIGVGNNVNSGRKFWQYERSPKLDDLLSQWSANRPKR